LCDASRRVTDERDECCVSGGGGEMGTDQRTLEAVIMPTVGVCKDTVLVLQTTVTPGWRVVYGGEGASERPGGWELRASEPELRFGGRNMGGRRLPALVALNMGRGRRGESDDGADQ